MSRWLYVLFICTGAAFVLTWFHVPALLLFLTAGLGILPLAALIGEAVEHIADYTGQRLGGLLFATFGNITELIISLFALRQGLVDVVRATIIGSILGNALLMLGVAVCVGGLKHGQLTFAARPASRYASLLAISLAGLMLPTIAEILASRTHQTQVVERGILLSDIIAVLLLVCYVGAILFSIFRWRNPSREEAFDPVSGTRAIAALKPLLASRRALARQSTPERQALVHQIDEAIRQIVTQETGMGGTFTLEDRVMKDQSLLGDIPALSKEPVEAASTQPPTLPRPPLWRGVLLLAVATTGVAIMAEVLVSAIEPVTAVLHWNRAFVGLVFVPFIGGLPDYYNTVTMALEKRIDIVLAATTGSSVQIALLVAPVLVLASLLAPKPLDLVFSVVELAVLGLTAFLFSEVVQDGELVWLEGLLLTALYIMMASTVFLFGS